MVREATIYDVMIASPGDVATEREIAREVVQEWNAVHSASSDSFLNAVGWETHSSPAMGERPQEIINQQILQQADLLIAIFWTRLGTPTGVAASGTVEEIQEHVGAGKPALLYFSAAPVQPASVDSEQFAGLQAFKAECMKQGLVETYESLSEFREKLTRQLAQTVLRSFRGSHAEVAVEPSRPSPSLSDEAKQLLVNTAQDSNGRLMRIGTMHGMIIQTNGRNLCESGNARSEAQWEGAIEELRNLALLQDRGHKGEVFSLTTEGYRLADTLRGER